MILTTTFQSGTSEWSTASGYALSVLESLASTRDQSILIRNKGKWLWKSLISMLVKEGRDKIEEAVLNRYRVTEECSDDGGILD